MHQTSKLPFKARLKGPERRAAVERAAAQVFAARGYEASTVDDIAAAAGVTKRVIYDHFESKRALHIALLDKHAEELTAFVAARIGAGHTAHTRMVAGVTAFFQFVEEHPYAWRMLFRDAPIDQEIARLHRDVQARATAAVAGFLSAEDQFSIGAHDRGGAWLEMTAELLKTAINGLAGWWYEHRDIPRDELVTVVLDLTWTGLSALAEPTR